MTDPNGPAFEAALAAMRTGLRPRPGRHRLRRHDRLRRPAGRAVRRRPGAALGIEDPASNAHAPNESLHEGDFKKLMASLVRLFDNLGKLTAGQGEVG